MTKSQRFTSSTGTLLSQRIDLDPWGVETAKTVDPTSLQQKPVHRFTTYERDANGTDEAMNRRYNSVRSRFEQPDPFDGSYDLSNPQSFNRYSYVQNDPVNFVDPSGLESSFTCQIGDPMCNLGGVTVTTTFEIDAPSTALTEFFDDVLNLNQGEDLIDIGGGGTSTGDTGKGTTPQKPTKQTIDPLTSYLHCDPKFMDAMKSASKTAESRNIEMGFNVSGGSNPPYGITMGNPQGASSGSMVAPPIVGNTIASAHYHPGTVYPNGADIKVAEGGGKRKDKKSGNPIAAQQPFPVYVFSPAGLSVYDPARQETYRLMDGTKWRTSTSQAECKQNTKTNDKL